MLRRNPENWTWTANENRDREKENLDADAGGHVDVINLEGYPLLEDPIELVDGPNTSRWFPEWTWEAAKQADVLLYLAFFKFPHTPNPDYVLPMHCAGFDTMPQLRREMPEKLVLPSTGTRVVFGT